MKSFLTTLFLIICSISIAQHNKALAIDYFKQAQKKSVKVQIKGHNHTSSGQFKLMTSDFNTNFCVLIPEHDSVIYYYTKAIELDSTFYKAYLKRGIVQAYNLMFVKQNVNPETVQKTLQDFDVILNISKDNVSFTLRTLQLKAFFLTKINHHQEALKVINLAFSLIEKHKTKHMSNIFHYCFAHIIQHDKPETALTHYNQIISSINQVNVFRNVYYTSQYELACMYEKRQQDSLAIIHFQKAINYYSESNISLLKGVYWEMRVMYYIILSENWKKLQHHKEIQNAIHYFDQVIKNKVPEMEQAYFEKIFLYSLTGKHKKVIQLCTWYINKNSDTELKPFYRRRGSSYVACKEYEKALSDYNLLEHNEHATLADENSILQKMSWNCGYNRGTKKEYANYLRTRADLKYKTNDLGGACEDWKKAIEVNPQFNKSYVDFFDDKTSKYCK